MMINSNSTGVSLRLYSPYTSSFAESAIPASMALHIIAIFVSKVHFCLLPIVQPNFQLHC